MPAFPYHEWQIVEDTYNPAQNHFTETIFFLGNGYIGTRGTPEEGIDPKLSCRYTLAAPVYDMVKAGGWRVPFVKDCSVMAKVADWFPIDLTIDGEPFDPTTGKVLDFRRVLDMREGVMTRTLTWESPRKRRTQFTIRRIVCRHNRHLAATSYAFRPLNYTAKASIVTSLEASDANLQDESGGGALTSDGAFLCLQTLITKFDTAMAFRTRLTRDGKALKADSDLLRDDKYVARKFAFTAEEGVEYRLDKTVAVCTSRDLTEGAPLERAKGLVADAHVQGFEGLLAEHRAAWEHIWSRNDVQIEGDPAAQQGIRLCIFNMHQNFAGDDPLVNMAAKGLSGPGYGGLYWWDSEIYMIPFFVHTDPDKARNLCLYRYHTLDGARAKAKVMGYNGAMFPWVTIDGYEHSGDWEYGMFEQHVSSAVAYSFNHYVEATGDTDLLWDYGAEILIETSRFWASRAYFHPRRKQYVLNGVTGPDEYAVNVNNNCYTNYMAKVNLELGANVVKRMKAEQPAKWKKLARKLKFDEKEVANWRAIARKMYIPFDEEMGIHLQDDAFLDREHFVDADMPAKMHPLNKHWTWERLMRSQAVKQSDIVLLMYLRNDDFLRDVKLANYTFYEPKTTHDSSLSPCTHSIMAAELGLDDTAFRYYLRSARLDLDDVNFNAHEGFHIANMAGSWLSIVAGFGGMRISKGRLTFNPRLPRKWKSLLFRLAYQGRIIEVAMDAKQTVFRLIDGAPLTIYVGDDKLRLRLGSEQHKGA